MVDFHIETMLATMSRWTMLDHNFHIETIYRNVMLDYSWPWLIFILRQ